MLSQYSGEWCMEGALMCVYLRELVQEDVAGEWKNSTILSTPLGALDTRHLKNVGKNEVHKPMLFLSCFIDF